MSAFSVGQTVCFRRHNLNSVGVIENVKKVGRKFQYQIWDSRFGKVYHSIEAVWTNAVQWEQLLDAGVVKLPDWRRLRKQKQS